MKNLTWNKIVNPNKVVEAIHSEFDSATENLILEASRSLQNSKTSNEKVKTKGERLKSLGFTKSPEVLQFEQDSEKSKELLESQELVLYYNRTYPFLKFITEEKLDEICNRYGLMYTSVDRYKKTVPTKNLEEIENSQPLNPLDSPYRRYFFYSRDSSFLTSNKITRFMSKGFVMEERGRSLVDRWGDANPKLVSEYVSKKLNVDPSFYKEMNYDIHIRKEKINREGLFIAAPKSHFDLEGLKSSNGLGFFNRTLIEPEDPVVFRWVKGGVQILTKWGLEANDPDLQLGILN